MIYKVKNMYSEEERYIFFFADVPHLIKTARNCLWSSGSDFSPRFMWNNGSYLLWQHIKTMFYEDMDNGLKLMPKLTTDHILLNSYSKMRVYLAAEILSNTVGNMLLKFGPEEAKGTAGFCLQMDQFFDCFNVRNTKEHKKTGKPFLAPYTTVDPKKDERFSFLDKFLKYLDDWKKSTMERPGEFSQTNRNNMFLSLPTYNGIKISISSLKEIIPFLLDQCGFDYVLTEKFCQDDIENYFGKQRAIGRFKDNPTAKDSIYNDNIIKSQFDTRPIAGNVRKAEFDPKDIPDTPIKKRKC
uniref:Transposable element P transposase-like GTP-binding insertion domain-containing protein n=1 Tax=Clytia hemisphaerica TaxID=252671 RepID=A0A7M5V4G0_9CNID